MVCPKTRVSLGIRRCIIVWKKPSMFEKWWGDVEGRIFTCFLVIEESSKAVRSPSAVTIIADNLREGCIVITGVFKGVRFEVIRSPAIMLPHASRLIGLITIGLFSLIGERGLSRGCPITT